MKQRYSSELSPLLLHIIAEKHIEHEVFRLRAGGADYDSWHGLGPGNELGGPHYMGEVRRKKIISVERFFPLNRHLY